MDDEVKKSLDELDSAADELLEKSRKSKAAKKDKDKKKDVTKSEDEVKNEKPAKQDHPSEGTDVDNQDKVVEDDKTDAGEPHETHNIDKGKRCGSDDVEKSKDAKKSVSAGLKDNEKLKKSMDNGNAAFLSLFTQIQAQALDQLNNKIEKSLNSKNDFVKSVSKAVTTLVKSNGSLFDLVKSQADRVQALEDTVDKISHQPLVRKSVQDIHAVEKPFNVSAGLEGNDSLTKGQVIQKLTEAAMDKKSPINAQDVAQYEVQPILKAMRPEVQNFIANQFKK